MAATIEDIVRENPQTKTLVLGTALDAQPGQFAMLWLPGLDEKPFSLMDDNPLAFAIAAVGPLSRQLHRLVAGDRVWVRGPLGTGFRPRPDDGGNHLLVGGGYGSAPLLYLARRMPKAATVRVAIGARAADDLLLVDQFESVAAEVAITTEDGSAGEQGLVTTAVEKLIGTARPDMVYACGPHGMLEAVRAQCAAHSVAAQLSWEAYMRCGIGLCGSCEHEGRLLCADGPVLEYAAGVPKDDD
jgi:dihydroorotate dehydrogenase electron transfer subunit